MQYRFTAHITTEKKLTALELSNISANIYEHIGEEMHASIKGFRKIKTCHVIKEEGGGFEKELLESLKELAYQVQQDVPAERATRHLFDAVADAQILFRKAEGK